MNNGKKVTIIIFILIALYSLWNGRNIILGPSITITSPKQGQEITTNPVYIEGSGSNISFISLDGRQIFLDKDGKFKENILLSPGENLVEIFAKDRFNKEKTVSLYLYNKVPN